MIFWCLILVSALTIIGISAYLDHLSGKSAKNKLNLAAIVTIVISFIIIYIEFLTPYADAVFMIVSMIILAAPLWIPGLMLFKEKYDEMEKQQKANFYAGVFLVVLVVSGWGFVKFNEQQEIKAEQIRIQAEQEERRAREEEQRQKESKQQQTTSNFFDDYFYDSDEYYENDSGYVYDEYFGKYFDAEETIYSYDVASSFIKDIGYNYYLKTLFIVFKTSPDYIYEYYDVSADEWHGLLDADSHGKYFNANIKNKYEFDKYSKWD